MKESLSKPIVSVIFSNNESVDLLPELIASSVKSDLRGKWRRFVNSTALLVDAGNGTPELDVGEILNKSLIASLKELRVTESPPVRAFSRGTILYRISDAISLCRRASRESRSALASSHVNSQVTPAKSTEERQQIAKGEFKKTRHFFDPVTFCCSCKNTPTFRLNTSSA